MMVCLSKWTENCSAFALLNLGYGCHTEKSVLGWITEIYGR